MNGTKNLFVSNNCVYVWLHRKQWDPCFSIRCIRVHKFQLILVFNGTPCGTVASQQTSHRKEHTGFSRTKIFGPLLVHIWSSGPLKIILDFRG